MRELCGRQNLNFFLVNDIWVNEFHRNLESRDVGFWVLLDLIANQTTEADHEYQLVVPARKRGYKLALLRSTIRASHGSPRC